MAHRINSLRRNIWSLLEAKRTLFDTGAEWIGSEWPKADIGCAWWLQGSAAIPAVSARREPFWSGSTIVEL